MRIAILVLCDERDLPIGAAVRAELVQRGHDATLETCDAAEEGLGPKAREALPHASKVVVVVREGGRGNRLLHAAEDEAPKDTTVVSLIADGSPDGSVSARTHARIEALGDTLSPRAAPPKSCARTVRSQARCGAPQGRPFESALLGVDSPSAIGSMEPS